MMKLARHTRWNGARRRAEEHEPDTTIPGDPAQPGDDRRRLHQSEAGLALGAGGISAVDPKTAALLQVGASVTIGSSPVCLQWSVARAMAAGATEDEIADVLLAIAPVTGLGRIAAAAPDVAIALGYDVAAALDRSYCNYACSTP
jgi:4-carboxymuconolactone decarboxylase